MCIRQYFFHKWDVYAHEHSDQKTTSFPKCGAIVIYEMSARRHFLRTSDEGASASFARMCRIRLDRNSYNIFGNEHYV
jgi:hypothetical protein